MSRLGSMGGLPKLHKILTQSTPDALRSGVSEERRHYFGPDSLEDRSAAFFRSAATPEQARKPLVPTN